MEVEQQRKGIRNVDDDTLDETTRGSITKWRLDRNYITNISCTLPMTKLTSLYLGVNSLVTFPDVSMCPLLCELYLNNNAITEISMDVLSSLHYLKILDLRKNRITKLQLPKSCAALTFFSISGNAVEKIGDLPEMPLLNKLCLFGNGKMKKQDCATLLQHTPNVKHLFVAGTGMAAYPRADAQQQEDIVQVLHKIITIDGQFVTQRNSNI